MNSPDELLKYQREVQAKIGRNLLNYQLIEGLIKAIVSLSSIEIRKNVNGEFEAKNSKSKRMMLGLLIGKYLSEIATLTEESELRRPDEINLESAETHSRFDFRQVFSDPYQYNLLKESTEKLLDDRNVLVHHFCEFHTLDSIESCENALKYLESKTDFIHEQYEYFNNLLIQIENSMKTHAEFIKSRDFSELLQTAVLDSNPIKLH